jgi:hypothetical protein
MNPETKKTHNFSPKEPGYTMNQIPLSEDTLDSLKRVSPIDSKILVFHGGKGTGKYMAAEALASHLKMKIIITRYQDLCNENGRFDTEKFKKALENAHDGKAILFISAVEVALQETKEIFKLHGKYGRGLVVIACPPINAADPSSAVESLLSEFIEFEKLDKQTRRSALKKLLIQDKDTEPFTEEEWIHILAYTDSFSADDVVYVTDLYHQNNKELRNARPEIVSEIFIACINFIRDIKSKEKINSSKNLEKYIKKNMAVYRLLCLVAYSAYKSKSQINAIESEELNTFLATNHMGDIVFSYKFTEAENEIKTKGNFEMLQNIVSELFSYNYLRETFGIVFNFIIKTSMMKDLDEIQNNTEYDYRKYDYSKFNVLINFVRMSTKKLEKDFPKEEVKSLKKEIEVACIEWAKRKKYLQTKQEHWFSTEDKKMPLRVAEMMKRVDDILNRSRKATSGATSKLHCDKDKPS